jgi:hypothetical protein
MPLLATCTICGRQSHVPDCARGGLVWCVACSNFYVLAAKVPSAVPSEPRLGQYAKPFRTACTHCGRESLVPGGALGRSAWCPQCCQPYTVAKKSSDVSIAALVGGDVAGPEAWEGDAAEPVGQLPASEPTPGFEDTAVTPGTVPAPAALPIYRALPRPQPEEPEDDEPRPEDPLGLGALCLGCIALLCGMLSWFCWLVVPLSLIGLVTGVVSLVRAFRYRHVRRTFPVAGTMVAATVLVVSLAYPGLLGPIYWAYKAEPPRSPYPTRPATTAKKSLNF